VKPGSLGPSLDVVHLANKLGPVILVDHGRHEFLFIVCSSPVHQHEESHPERNLLVIHDGIDVGDNTVV
jgi:hypothetical protein